MTTILYCHETKEIGIDSRITAGGNIMDENAKKYFEHDSGTWFFSGCPIDINKAIEILDGDYSERRIKAASKNKINFGAIIDKGGVVYLYYDCSDGDYVFEKAKHSDAFGSGAQFALCALDFGCEVDECIKYASKKDVYTNDKVYLHKCSK